MNTIEPCTMDQSAYDALDDGWDLEKRNRIAEHRVALLRAFFETFGLWEESASEAAAHSVIATVLREPQERDDAALERRLIAVAREWVRDFSGTSASVPGDWCARAPVLLSRFPAAFLATPLPRRV